MCMHFVASELTNTCENAFDIHCIIAEIVVSPSDTTVFLDHSALFTCETTGAVYGYWRVNGTAYNELPPELRNVLDADQESVGENEVYTLTIPGRAEYNETVVQCVAGDDEGGSIESTNVTLKVQGKEHSLCLKPIFLSNAERIKTLATCFYVTTDRFADISRTPEGRKWSELSHHLVECSVLSGCEWGGP